MMRMPMRRMAKPEEIASVVVHLSSDKAAYATGQVIAVDDGKAVGSRVFDDL